VNGLEKEYDGVLKVEELQATTPESKKLIDQYGLTTHGMLIFDKHEALAKKLDGHFLDEPEIRDAVASVIGY
jgi:hypothetical protein